jgi:ankyrin repeat protein
MDSFKEELTVGKVKSALKTLPKGSDAYDVAYAAAMERIFAQGEQSSETARKILSWILCAHRPLSTQELLHSLAVEAEDEDSGAGSTLDEDNFMDTGQILSICAGLVTIDEQGDTVRFIHYTTQEYLERNREKWLPCANLEISRTCSAYLSLEELSAGPCSTKQDYDRRVESLALLDYAAMHWGIHMESLSEADFASDLGKNVKMQALEFFSNARTLSSASQTLFMSGEEFFFEDTVAQEGAGFSATHWIARFGLTLFFNKALRAPGEAQWDNRDSGGRTPLSWAAGEGHEVVSNLLLETGTVDVDSKDNLGRTPLSWASGNGRRKTVQLLWDKKADVNSRDDNGQTPLLWATQNCHGAVVELLLSNGIVEVDSRDDRGWTPLFWAVRRGDEAIVKLLLDTRQVDVSSKDTNGQTPLSWAVQKGSEAMITLLLDSGTADFDTKSENGQTLLGLASEYGQEAAVKLLLATGKADVNCRDDIGQTPLMLAAKCEHEAVVRVLLDTGGVDVDWKDIFGGTALLWAARNGQEAIVKLLLDTGKVDVHWRDNFDWTPMRHATENGYGAIANLLLSTGSDQVVPPSHG